MKKIILVLILFISHYSNAQWTKTNGPQGALPRCFARISTGIICGSAQGMYISGDEGQSWNDFSPIKSNEILSLLTFSDTIVAIYVKRMYYYNPFDSVFTITSFDGGSTWMNPVLITPDGPGRAELFSLGNYILTGTYDNLFQSFDYGLSWSVVSMPAGLTFKMISHSRNNILIETKDASINPFFFMSDSSLNLQPIISGDSIEDFVILDSIVFGVISPVNGSNEIVKSFDFGQTWNSSISLTNSWAFRLQVIHDSLYYYDTFSGYYATPDHGVTWTPSPEPHGVEFPFGITLLNGDEITFGYKYKTVVRYVPALDTVFVSDSGMLGAYVIYVASFDSTLYCDTYLGMYKSSDAGATWQHMNDYYDYDPSGLLVYGDTLFNQEYDFIRSYDGGVTWTTIPTTPYTTADLARKNNRLYRSASNTGGIWYSDDFGDNWAQLPQLPFQIHPPPCAYDIGQNGSICLHGNNLFVVTPAGSVFKLDASDTQWFFSYCFGNLTSGSDYPTINSVDNKLVITTKSTMYVSSDAGQTWHESLLNGVPLDNHGDKMCPASLVGNNGELIGITKNHEIYYSDDAGDNWLPFPGVLPFIPLSLTMHNGQLFAGSSHLSVWSSNRIISSVFNSSPENSRLSIYPNPSADFFRIKINNFSNDNLSLQLYNELGKLVLLSKINSEITNVDTKSIPVGIYFGVVMDKDGNRVSNFKVSVIK